MDHGRPILREFISGVIVSTDSGSLQSPSSQDYTLAEILNRFEEDLRNGLNPSVAEYSERYSQFAEELKDRLSHLAIAADHATDVSTDHSDDLLSQRLGDFLILRQIGRGGMGVVYEAEQVSLRRKVALKILPLAYATQNRFVARFEREARAAANLHHTNIVPVFGVGSERGIHYIAMQFIDGKGLDQVIASAVAGKTSLGMLPTRVTAQESEGNPDVAATDTAYTLIQRQIEATVIRADAESAAIADDGMEHATTDFSVATCETAPLTEVPLDSLRDYCESVARIGSQIADALSYAHQKGVLHRDIKPSNLLLDRQGTAWMTDFGLAKIVDDQDLTNAGDVLGTIRYMAPEAFGGHANARSDIYSLGLTLYEMLSLKPAFVEKDRHKLIRQVLDEQPAHLSRTSKLFPDDLVTIIHKAIDRDPNARYQTASEFCDDLNRFRNDEPILARRSSWYVQCARWYRRNPVVGKLTVAVMSLLLLLTTGASVAAVIFRDLANTNGTLASSLQEEKTKAESNFDLANHEKERALDNLSTALSALDEVYIDGIGLNRLLIQSSPQRANLTPLEISAPAPLSQQERELIDRGLAFYDELAARNPDDSPAGILAARAYVRIGVLQAAIGELELAEASERKALARFDALLTLAPNNVEYLREKAACLDALAYVAPTWEEAQGHFQAAFDAYTEVIEYTPDSPKAFEQRAYIARNLDNEEQFQNDLLEAARIAPDNAEFVGRTAEVYIARRDFENAILIGRKAVDLKPSHVMSRVGLSRVYRKALSFTMNNPSSSYRGDIDRFCEEGLATIDQAVDLDPNNWQALKCRAEFLAQVGQADAAAVDLARLAELNPQFDVGWLQALVMRSHFDEEAAIDALRGYCERHPNDIWALNDLIELMPMSNAEDPELISRISRFIAMKPSFEPMQQRLKAYSILTGGESEDVNASQSMFGPAARRTMLEKALELSNLAGSVDNRPGLQAQILRHSLDRISVFPLVDSTDQELMENAYRNAYLGMCLHEKLRWLDKSVPFYQEAVRVFESLVARADDESPPGRSWYLRELAYFQSFLSRNYFELNEMSLAREVCNESLHNHQQLKIANPDDDTYTERITWNERLLTQIVERE